MFSSNKSAFKPWKRTFNAYEIFIELIESGEIRLVGRDKVVLTPFESVLYMENLYIKSSNGIIKVVKNPPKGVK